MSRAICSMGAFQPGEDVGPDDRVGFHDLGRPGPVGFLPGFCRTASGMPILPTSCIEAAWRMASASLPIQSAATASTWLNADHPADVHRRLVVAPLGGRNQPANDLLLGLHGCRPCARGPCLPVASYGRMLNQQIAGQHGRERQADRQDRGRPPRPMGRLELLGVAAQTMVQGWPAPPRAAP